MKLRRSCRILLAVALALAVVVGACTEPSGPGAPGASTPPGSGPAEASPSASYDYGY